MTAELRGKTLCVKVLGDLLLVVHGSANPDTDEWRRYCEIARAVLEARGKLRTLVISEGSGPSAAQRTLYKDEVGPEGVRVAVLTSSAVTRAVLTAMSWFNSEMRSFESDELAVALAFLGVEEPPRLRDVLEEIRDELGLKGQRVGASG